MIHKLHVNTFAITITDVLFEACFSKAHSRKEFLIRFYWQCTVAFYQFRMVKNLVWERFPTIIMITDRPLKESYNQGTYQDLCIEEEQKSEN